MAVSKTTGRAKSMPIGIGIGVVTGMAIILVLLAILSKLVLLNILREENTGYGIMASLIVSPFIGATVAMKLVKRRKMLVAFATGAGMFCIMIALTALLFGGMYDGVPVTTALFASGSLLAALLQMKQDGGSPKYIRHQGGL